MTWHQRPYGEPEFDPIFAEAERLDVPIILHGGTVQGLGLDMLRRFADAHVLEHPLPLLIHLTNMVYGGVFERHPSLRVGFFEAGSSWTLYMMDRLDYDFEVHKGRDPDLKNLTKTPSEIISGGNIFVTCEPAERFLPVALQALGEGQILYASDFPHELEYEEYPEGIKKLADRTDISETARRNILGDTARRFYGLGKTAAAKPAGVTSQARA